MRHRKSGRKLGRNTSHRKALGQNILKSLFQHEKIITTLPKAKEYAPRAEKLITLAKRAEVKVKEMEKRMEENNASEEEIKKAAAGIRVNYLRRIIAKLQDKKLSYKLFYEIAPKYAERNGGYTRVLKINKNRLGDNSPQGVLMLVESESESSES